MNSFLRLSLCLAAALPIATLAQPRTTDESAIRDIVKRYVDAREAKDEKAVEALFTNDADQLVSSGEWRKGRTDVVKGTLASSQLNAGKRTITVESIRFLSTNVALADGRYEIAGNAAAAEPRKMWTTLIMTRDPAGWHIAAIRNMLPAPTR